MQQLHAQARMIREFLHVERNDLVLSHPQAARIETRFRRLLGRKPNPQRARHVELLLVETELVFVVEYRNEVFEAVVQHVRDVLLVLVVFESVAQHPDLFVDVAGTFEGVDDRDIESRRRFQLRAGFEHLDHHVFEMRALGAIRVGVVATVGDLVDRVVEVLPRPSHSLRDNRHVGEPKRCLVGLDELHHVDPVKIELVVEDLKPLGREVEALIDKLEKCLHLPKPPTLGGHSSRP